MILKLDTIGNKGAIDVQGVRRISLQAMPTGGAPSSAVLEVKRAFGAQSPSVSFSTAQTITLDGTAITEIDVTDTAWLHLVCTTAESGISVDLEYTTGGPMRGQAYIVDLDATATGVRGTLDAAGSYKTFVLAEAHGDTNSSAFEIKRAVQPGYRAVSFSPAVNLTIDGATITEIDTARTGALVAVCGTSQASQRLSLWVYRRGETMAETHNDFLIEAAAGRVPGYSVNRKFGRNTDVDTGSVPEDIWGGGGVYTGFPHGGSAETVDVVSSDGNDTSAGTGARTVQIVGLDADFNEQTETVTMNGTTAVTTTATWRRVNRVRVTTAGSGLTNAGTITVNHTTTTANVFASIVASAGQSTVMALTVPAGYKMLIKAIKIEIDRSSGTSAGASVSLRVSESETGVSRIIDYMFPVVGSPSDKQYLIPEVIGEKTDVWLRVDDVSSNNTTIEGDMQYMLVPK